MASFDGTPIDVDVTLPATGDGPFPTVVMLHGFGGSKTGFQSTDPSARQRLNSTALAQRGYAVVTPSIRGFGRSCGAPDSRTPDCASGYIRLADQRYEARDVQELLGRLVDQRVADPERLGVTGESYGGGISMSLAYLKDRIRRPDGTYVPWRSPGGRELSIAASAPIIPWSDLASALVHNGRGPRPDEGRERPGGRAAVGRRPATRRQRLVARGIYRLTRNQRGRVRFQLNANGYRLVAGHSVKLELLGQDAPSFRPSRTAFSVGVELTALQIPSRERAPGLAGPPASEPCGGEYAGRTFVMTAGGRSRSRTCPIASKPTQPPDGAGD